MADLPDTTPRSEWPAKAADRIVETVDAIKAKTTRPALIASRGLVYGIALIVLGILALVLLLVAVFRLSAELSEDIASQHYWAYLAWGALLTLVGVVLLRKAAQAPDPDPDR
jgi:uncharacterized membrane protein